MNLQKHFLCQLMAFCCIFCFSFNFSFGQTCSPCITTNIEPQCPNPLLQNIPISTVTYEASTEIATGCNITWKVTHGRIYIGGSSYGTSYGPVPFNSKDDIQIRWDNTSVPGTIKVTVSDCDFSDSEGEDEKTVPIISLKNQELPALELVGFSGNEIPYCTTVFDIRIGDGMGPIFVGTDQDPNTGTGEVPDFFDWTVPSGMIIDGNISNGSPIRLTTSQVTIETNGCNGGFFDVVAVHESCAGTTGIGVNSGIHTFSKFQNIVIGRSQIGTVNINKLVTRCGIKEYIWFQLLDIPCATSFSHVAPSGWTKAYESGNFVAYKTNGLHGGIFSMTANLDCGTSIEHSRVISFLEPNLSTINGPESLCNNNTVTYTIPSGAPNSSFPNSSFSWSVSPNLQIIGGTTGTSVDVKPINATSENGPAWIKVESSCISQSAQKNIHVGVPSHIIINAQVDPSSPGSSLPYDELCYGQDNYVTASYPSSVNSFSWSLTGGSAHVQGVDYQTTLVHPYRNNTITLSVTATNSCGTSQPITHGFDVTYCGFFFNVGPNPTSEFLQISLAQEDTEPEPHSGETEVILYNSKQKEVKKRKTTKTQIQLDVRDLDPGLYFLKVFKGKKVEVKKILISRK